MLDCKPDKLAQNAPSQSEAWEARQTIPGVHISRQAIPEFNGGNTLDKREVTDPREVEWNTCRDRGECKVKEQSGT